MGYCNIEIEFFMTMIYQTVMTKVCAFENFYQNVMHFEFAGYGDHNKIFITNK